MNIEEKLITTECELRSQQGKLGETIIWGTCIVCILVGLLPLFSGALINEEAPNGTAANIVLSENYVRLIGILSIPFIIGLTSGIILIKSSIKHIGNSYFVSHSKNEVEPNRNN